MLSVLQFECAYAILLRLLKFYGVNCKRNNEVGQLGQSVLPDEVDQLLYEIDCVSPNILWSLES